MTGPVFATPKSCPTEPGKHQQRSCGWFWHACYNTGGAGQAILPNGVVGRADQPIPVAVGTGKRSIGLAKLRNPPQVVLIVDGAINVEVGRGAKIAANNGRGRSADRGHRPRSR